jgi:Icc-related predicted phosphoesterase
MRIVAISDTHGSHRDLTLPDGDVLIHAGDFMLSGKDAREIFDFNAWLGEQPFKHRICVAGNHDILFESDPIVAASFLSNATYLMDSSVEICGVKFYGSPWQPRFMDWAFNVDRGAPIRKIWAKIPEDVNVLITHTPPYGILDELRPPSEHLGCEELAIAIGRLSPKMHIFGHIHGSAGTLSIGDKRFINAASMNEAYRIANYPIVVDFDA